MADNAPFSVDNLSLYYGNYNSSSDKEITGSWNVYKGRSSFSIRRKGQNSAKPMASVSILPEQLWTFVYVADKLASKGVESKIKMTIPKWEDGKFKDAGVLVLGIDKNFTPYLGVSTPEMGAYPFPIRLRRPSIASDEMFTKEELAAITIKAVFRDIAEHLTQMEVISNEKRNFQPRNNNGGGNNYRNNNGGGNKESSGSSSIDDDSMPF